MSNLQEENIPLPQQDMGAVIILARPNAATKRQYSGNSATGVHAVIPGCVSKEAIQPSFVIPDGAKRRSGISKLQRGIPQCALAYPIYRDSGFDALHRPGMTASRRQRPDFNLSATFGAK
jgi:hypothetical protein